MKKVIVSLVFLASNCCIAAMIHDDQDGEIDTVREKASVNATVTAKGRISCNYGNKGGYCEIADSLTTYSFSLSEKNAVDWYFENIRQPTVKLQDTDIVIPVFEKDALTHFQDCAAEVLKSGDRLTVKIRLQGCAHAKQLYEPALKASVAD